jgi:hypothetical protein
VCRCASFRTPENVRREWVEKRGLRSFGSKEYDEALDAVCRRVNVNTQHSHKNDEIPAIEELVVRGWLVVSCLSTQGRRVSTEHIHTLEAPCLTQSYRPSRHDHAQVNPNNEALFQGAKSIGMRCLPVPRNVKGCKDCGGCERGCPYSGSGPLLN